MAIVVLASSPVISSSSSHESYVFPGTAFFDFFFFVFLGGSIAGWFPPAIADAASNMESNGEFGSGVDRHCGHPPSPAPPSFAAATRVIKPRPLRPSNGHTPPSRWHARAPLLSGATRCATPETNTAVRTAAFIAPSPITPDRVPG